MAGVLPKSVDEKNIRICPCGLEFVVTADISWLRKESGGNEFLGEEVKDRFVRCDGRGGCVRGEFEQK